MGRLGQPEEIALACLYLAADATYSTGLNLYASGGAELDYGFKANIDQFFWYLIMTDTFPFVET